MSFTSIVKNEVSKLELSEIEAIACLSAIIRNVEKDEKTIKITTENASFARTIFKHFKDIFALVAKVSVRRGYNYNKNYIYILEIQNKVLDVLSTLGLYDQKILDVPKKYIIDDTDSIRAYLLGLFLISGSINDPKKSRYHLEFIVNSREYSEFVVDLLNKFYLNAKYLKRENKYMVYIKGSEKIGDFLRIISATNALLYYEDIRIYRDHKNMTNRLNNCEQANVDKTILAASKQVKDIQKIIDSSSLDILDEKEKVVAEYRLKYPEVSILELSEIISSETQKQITKSGVYHRMKKISEIASKIKTLNFK